MISIPQELIEQIVRGNVLLFIGDRLTPDSAGRTEMDALATQLLNRLGPAAGADPSMTPPEAFQVYEDATGRRALIQAVRDYLEAQGDEPLQEHQLIAGLAQCKLLVTTLLDERLERAFERAGRALNEVVGSADLAFDDERKVQLYRLRGSLERPDSLVLTEDDYETFFEDQESISVVLQGYFVRKTILFLGYDLADPHFKRLYRKVSASLDNFARRAFSYTEVPDAKVAQWCKRHGIQVVEGDLLKFLVALTQKLAEYTQQEQATQAAKAATSPAMAAIPVAAQAETQAATPAQAVTTGVPIPERPYKLLDSYEASDEVIFFGRAQETQYLTSLIHAHRLVLVYGASGVGKTSLIQAGVTPRLLRADPPYAVVTVRALEEPAQAIRKTLRRQLGRVNEALAASLPEAGSLVDFLAAAASMLPRPAGASDAPTLVVILDQFEEFFMRFNPQARAAFIDELAALNEARDVPVKVVISLREDWLASMSELERRIPEIFRTKMRVLPLRRDQASQAITAPVEQIGMSYEPALVDCLFDDLLEEQQEDAAAILPPQLQLICDALYENARSQERKVIGMEDYQAVGEVSGILSRYLQSALQEHPLQERQAAREILITLVSSQQTRTPANLQLLVASAAAPGEGIDSGVVESALERLVRQRLVRPLDISDASIGDASIGDASIGAGGQVYELTHDILAGTISGWLSDEERQLKRVREMLQRDLMDWRQDPAALLSPGKFERINALREQLRLSAEEAGYVLRAALRNVEEANYADVDYWMAQVASPGTASSGGEASQVGAITLEMLRHNAEQARLNAATSMPTAAKYDPAAKAGMETALAHVAFDDRSGGVRDMAAASLGTMGSYEGVRLLAGVLTAQARNGKKQSRRENPRAAEERERALRALALVRDADPKLLAEQPSWLRRQATTAMAKIRFWRYWPRNRMVTAVGALGGALGFGVGLSLPATWNDFATHGFDIGSMIVILFYVLLLGVLGLLAGGGLTFGISLGETLPRRRAKLGRLLGGALLGGFAFAAALFIPLLPVLAISPLALAGGWVFGLLVGLGITLPGRGPRPLVLAGGWLGALLGCLALGASGFAPFALDSASSDGLALLILLLCGGLSGLILAFFVSWAETRWPVEGAGVRAGAQRSPLAETDVVTPRLAPNAQ